MAAGQLKQGRVVQQDYIDGSLEASYSDVGAHGVHRIDKQSLYQITVDEIERYRSRNQGCLAGQGQDEVVVTRDGWPEI